MSDAADVQFSVVIVTFNNEKEIQGCLVSLTEELKSSKYQILVVDNDSRDKTRSIIRQILSEQRHNSGDIELVENDNNRGFTSALNHGLRISRGDYILVLNPDTEVQTGSLAALRSYLEAEPGTAIVAPQLLNTDRTVQHSCRRFPRRRDVFFEMLGLSHFFRESQVFNNWKMGDFDHTVRRKVDQPQGACLMFRRHLLQIVGFWDETFPMFFSDVDWCHRVKLAGYDIVFEPDAKVVHHQGASVLRDRSRMIWSSHRSFYRYFKKYRGGSISAPLNEFFGAILFLSAILRIIWQRKSGIIREVSALAT
ncbi:glycosyltransferase family 2 protein [bacterium]|nr:glycosyltransferase family 2 protein [bacterium]